MDTRTAISRFAITGCLVIATIWASASLRDSLAEPPRAAAKFECPGQPTFDRPELNRKWRILRFNTKVRVTNGFYKGMEGKLYEPLDGMKYGVLLSTSEGQLIARVPHDYLEVIVKAEKE